MADEERATFGHMVDIDLTDEDVAEKEHRNGEIDIAIAKIKSEKVKALAVFKTRLAPFEREKEALVKAIDSRRESIEVDCYLKADLESGKMLTIRDDNCDVVDQRELSEEEIAELRQEGLPFGDSDDDDAGEEAAVS